MKSFIAKPAEVERNWYVIDAEGKTLGRLASEVTSMLMGSEVPPRREFIHTHAKDADLDL